jgi:hypothetical protein
VRWGKSQSPEGRQMGIRIVMNQQRIPFVSPPAAYSVIWTLDLSLIAYFETGPEILTFLKVYKEFVSTLL